MTGDAYVIAVKGSSSAAASARSILDACAAFERAGKFIPDSVDADIASLIDKLGANASDLFFAEPVYGTAGLTFEVLVKPSDRYIDLVAAIASGLNVAFDLDSHGWPILSMAKGVEHDA